MVCQLLGIGSEMDIFSSVARDNAELRSAAEPRTGGSADMSTIDGDGVALEAPTLDELLPSEPAVAAPIRVHGKSFFAGDTKHFVKGVTYGPFAVGSHGAQFPERAVVERDFALMRNAGINTLRVFTVPPVWLLARPDEGGLRRYMGRLQNVAGDKPLVLTEFGIDSMRNGDDEQARILSWQVRTAFAAGVAGTFVFAWTDEWFTGGHLIENWAFGLVDRERRPKPAWHEIAARYKG